MASYFTFLTRWCPIERSRAGVEPDRPRALSGSGGGGGGGGLVCVQLLLINQLTPQAQLLAVDMLGLVDRLWLGILEAVPASRTHHARNHCTCLIVSPPGYAPGWRWAGWRWGGGGIGGVALGGVQVGSAQGRQGRCRASVVTDHAGRTGTLFSASYHEQWAIFNGLLIAHTGLASLFDS